MKKLACSLLIIIFLASSILFLGNVHASSTVGGPITSDTTWGIANSPYQLTGPVGVLSGATLTIEPGVTIDFKAYYIQVNGTLKAQGTSDKNIIFTTDYPFGQTEGFQIQFFPGSTNWNEQIQKGCIIENCFVHGSCIVITDCSPKISKNVFSNQTAQTLWINSDPALVASPLIVNNTFNLMGNACMHVRGSSTIVNNNIIGRGNEYGITASDNAYVLNNWIENCLVGVSINQQVILEGNTILYCSLHAVDSGDSAKILHNYISGNQIGIIGSGIIQDNTVINNKEGLDVNPPVSVTNNNIYSNSENNVVLRSQENVDLANNWWGTTDTHAITTSIHDSKYDFSLGTVNFEPILTDPSSTAPSSPNIDLSPLPTPTLTSSIQEPTPVLSPNYTPGQRLQTSSPNSLGAVSGSSSPDDPLAHLSFTEAIEIVLIIAGIVWVVGILTYVNRRSQKDVVKRAKRRKPVKQETGKLIEGTK